MNPRFAQAHNQWALNALRDSSEWEKALDAELAKGDEEHSAAKEEAAAAVDREMESREVSQGGEIMRGTPQKLAASAATRPAAMPSRSREEKPEAPMLDPNAARLRETVVEELSAQLAALHARGEDLQAREEQAAAEEHFHDAAALHDEWLKLRSQVKVSLDACVLARELCRLDCTLTFVTTWFPCSNWSATWRLLWPLRPRMQG